MTSDSRLLRAARAEPIDQTIITIVRMIMQSISV
jgi:hypothetical protein